MSLYVARPRCVYSDVVTPRMLPHGSMPTRKFSFRRKERGAFWPMLGLLVVLYFVGRMM